LLPAAFRDDVVAVARLQHVVAVAPIQRVVAGGAPK
jgi:hypothetical protein